MSNITYREFIDLIDILGLEVKTGIEHIFVVDSEDNLLAEISRYNRYILSTNYPEFMKISGVKREGVFTACHRLAKTNLSKRGNI